MGNPHILVLDDDPDILRELGRYLDDRFTVTCVSTLDEARRELSETACAEKYSVVVADMWLQEGKEGGLTLARELNEREIRPEVIILTAHPEIANSSKCMEAETFGYVEKGKENTFEVLEELCLKATKRWCQHYHRIPDSLLENPVALLFGEIVVVAGAFLGERDEEHIRRALRLAASRAARVEENGYVTKVTHDSFLALFDTVPQAVRAAFTMQRELANSLPPQLASFLRLREAVHWEKVERLRTSERDDIIGPALQVCLRVVNEAQPGQVIVSQKAHAELGDLKEVKIQDLGQCSLKDVSEPVQLYEVHLAFPNGESETAQSGQAKEEQTAFPN